MTESLWETETETRPEPDAVMDVELSEPTPKPSHRGRRGTSRSQVKRAAQLAVTLCRADTDQVEALASLAGADASDVAGLAVLLSADEQQVRRPFDDVAELRAAADMDAVVSAIALFEDKARFKALWSVLAGQGVVSGRAGSSATAAGLEAAKGAKALTQSQVEALSAPLGLLAQ